MQGQLTPSFGDYELIDTGDFEKLERFGQYVARRPEPQAIWRRSLPEGEWRCMADAAFLRDVRSDERGEWRLRPGMPPRWTVAYEYKDMALRMRLGLTSFKHVGIFPRRPTGTSSTIIAGRWLRAGRFLRIFPVRPRPGVTCRHTMLQCRQAPDRAGTGTLPPARGVASRRAC